MFYVTHNQELMFVSIPDTEKCKMSAEQFDTPIRFVKDFFLTIQCGIFVVHLYVVQEEP